MFRAIREQFGGVASWAVWAPAGDTPKSNIGDLSVFDADVNPGLLKVLHARAVLVGLNFSRTVDNDGPAFANFHDPRPKATDFKLRYGLSDTPCWGAYMTDIIKHVEEVDSGQLMARLRDAPEIERASISIFRAELDLLEARRPVLVALGKRVSAILRRNFDSEYSVIEVPHYAHYMSKEHYRACVLGRLRNAGVIHDGPEKV